MDQIITEIFKEDEELRNLLKKKIKKAVESPEFQANVTTRVCSLVESLELDDLYDHLNRVISDHVAENINNNIGALFGNKKSKKKENKQ